MSKKVFALGTALMVGLAFVASLIAQTTVTNTAASLAGKTLVTLQDSQVITGAITFDRDPSAPFVVTSGSAKVSNLNADTLDGIDGASFFLTSAAAVQSYTPTWTNSGTANSLGNGTIAGTYIQIGKFVSFRIIFTYGSTTTSGNGVWVFSVPVTAVGSGPAAGGIGLVATDVSASAIYAGAAINSTLSSFVPVTLASPVAAFTATAPVTWATGDQVYMSGYYFAT